MVSYQKKSFQKPKFSKWNPELPIFISSYFSVLYVLNTEQSASLSIIFVAI